MNAIDISVFGDKELQAKLADLTPKVQRKIVRSALRQGAKRVRDEARRLAPVDTGALKKSIKVRAARNLRRGSFGIAILTGTRAELGISPEAKFYYPAVVEFGGRGHGGRGYDAQPYLRPAMDATRAEVLGLVKQAIREALR